MIVLFAFVIVTMIMVLGLALDGLRGLRAATLTANAIDAAALAAAKGLRENNLSDGDAALVAQTYFNANVSDNAGVSFSPVQLVLNRETGWVQATATATIETTFGRIFQVETLDVTRKSRVIYDDPKKEIEVGIMLDVTGSMKGRKLKDLQEAAKIAVDALIPDRKIRTTARVALAPYSSSVNVGAFAANVSDGASADGCVIEREGRDAYTDTPPGPGAFLAAYPNPDLPKNNHYRCPGAEIEPLTDDKDRLNRAIDNFRADGYTAGHLGAAWAWYLISPKWGSLWPTESRPNRYNKKDLTKAVILMTDGEFNTSYYNGQKNKSSFSQTRELCDAMKARDVDVVVYTIGFELVDADALDVLRYCATDEDSFYRAADGDELREAFRDIAGKLISIRITD